MENKVDKKIKFIKPKMIRILNSLSIDTIKIPNKNYEIGKYPITIAEYMHFVKDTDSHDPEWVENDTKYKNMNLSDNAPIIGVSWYDAVAYCEWLREKTDRKYRLPNKEEWEYAGKEGNIDKWKINKNINDYAWYKQNSNNSNHIVGGKLPNKFGLYDMIGNVWEWTDNNRDNEVICGASYNVSLKKSSLSLYDKRNKHYQSKRVGFRIVLEVEKQKETHAYTKLEKEIKTSKYLTNMLLSDIDTVFGRERDLKNIDSLLSKNNKILITGVGGIGKTTLVSKYLEKVKDDYDYLAYVRIEQNYKQSIVSAFTKSLDISDDTLDDMYNMVVRKLDNLVGEKLIVIDDVENIDDKKSINEFLDTLDTWKIILVSRDVSLFDNASISSLVMDKLSYEGAKELLRYRLNRDITEDEIKLILRFSNYHPLSIILLSIIINNNNYLISAILDNIQLGTLSEQVELNNLLNEFILKHSNIGSYKSMEFVKLLKGSISLSTQDKLKVASQLSMLSHFQVDELVKIFKEEQSKFDEINRDVKYIDSVLHKEYVGSILNTEIYIPANGKVYEFEVNSKFYDIEIHKISDRTLNESQATKEMVNVTGATHQGTIKFKDNQQGNIEELNRLINEQFNKEYGLAFYSIIDEEKDKEDYINFIEAESEMEGWFYDNYDDPANFLPYETREGGYQYLYGGPYELDEVLYEEFGNTYPDEQIQYVIETIKHQYGDVGWEKKPNENEGYIESDDPYDPILREQEIKQMEADALEKAIEDEEKRLAKIQSSNTVIESQIDGDFNGWEGETIIKLMNGEFWKQSEYYYEYVYAYMPKVTIINSKTGFKMKVDGINKEVAVKKLKNAIEANIQGSFNGWDGNTVVELTNGEKWKQSSYAYSYSYAYNPEVIIYESDYGYKMKVDGNDEIVDVEKIH